MSLLSHKMCWKGKGHPHILYLLRSGKNVRRQVQHDKLACPLMSKEKQKIDRFFSFLLWFSALWKLVLSLDSKDPFDRKASTKIIAEKTRASSWWGRQLLGETFNNERRSAYTCVWSAPYPSSIDTLVSPWGPSSDSAGSLGWSSVSSSQYSMKQLESGRSFFKVAPVMFSNLYRLSRFLRSSICSHYLRHFAAHNLEEGSSVFGKYLNQGFKDRKW